MSSAQRVPGSPRATSEPTVSTMAKISYAVFAEAGTALTRH
jgi:hypothetical protein